jgi:hypothetical protein
VNSHSIILGISIGSAYIQAMVRIWTH